MLKICNKHLTWRRLILVLKNLGIGIFYVDALPDIIFVLHFRSPSSNRTCHVRSRVLIFWIFFVFDILVTAISKTCNGRVLSDNVSHSSRMHSWTIALFWDVFLISVSANKSWCFLVLVSMDTRYKCLLLYDYTKSWLKILFHNTQLVVIY